MTALSDYTSYYDQERTCWFTFSISGSYLSLLPWSLLCFEEYEQQLDINKLLKALKQSEGLKGRYIKTNVANLNSKPNCGIKKYFRWLI
jgi:hypothetical protein